MEGANSWNGVGIPESCLDLTFGFDDPKYSDRTLLLQIVGSDDQLLRHRDDILIEPRVKSIHISSLILAARSIFFRKLFSNGMLESEQKNVTLQIDISEEASLMDLLKYIYSNNLPTSMNALLALLVTADKFGVASCLRDCSRSLQNLPMTRESASIYLDLSLSVLVFPVVEPLIDAAKQFLIANFKDLDKFQKEMLNLPLVGIQAVLSRDDLEVTSENVVYDFVITWAREHYLDLEERRRILKTYLLHLIRFPYMTTTKLTEEVQTCSDIDPEDALKIVIRALVFKAETPHQKRYLAKEEGNTESHRQIVERAYKYRPIKLVEPALPQQCIVYLNFTREQLTNIFPKGRIYSETFHLGEQALVLFGVCSESQIGHRFWLALKLTVLGSATYTINYEIQLRMKPTEKFKTWEEGSTTFSVQEKIKYFKSVPWTEFIGVDSTYFINDLLHVRAELTVKE